MTEPKRIHGYTGYKITEADRERLLTLFPPRYPDLVADHVTVNFGVLSTEPLPAGHSGSIVGYIDNGASVEALIVEIDGQPERPNGGTYHITWSLDRAQGATPKDSNAVITTFPSRPVRPIPFTLVPTFFPFHKKADTSSPTVESDTKIAALRQIHSSHFALGVDGSKTIKEAAFDDLEPEAVTAWYRRMLNQLREDR